MYEVRRFEGIESQLRPLYQVATWEYLARFPLSYRAARVRRPAAWQLSKANTGDAGWFCPRGMNPPLSNTSRLFV